MLFLLIYRVLKWRKSNVHLKIRKLEKSVTTENHLQPMHFFFSDFLFRSLNMSRFWNKRPEKAERKLLIPGWNPWMVSSKLDSKYRIHYYHSDYLLLWCECADAGLTTSHPVVLSSPAATTGGAAFPKRCWEWLISHQLRERRRRRVNRRQKNSCSTCHFLIIECTEQLAVRRKHARKHTERISGVSGVGGHQWDTLRLTLIFTACSLLSFISFCVHLVPSLRGFHSSQPFPLCWFYSTSLLMLIFTFPLPLPPPPSPSISVSTEAPWPH